MERKHGGERSDRQQQEAGKRYVMDCREQGQGCSLTISGSMEEVLSTCEMHARKAHGMRGTEEELRNQLRESVKEEGSRTEKRAEMPPA